MISEIKNQIDRINTQIEAEKRINAVWNKYKDCPMKTAVIHQTIGVVRGLEVAKEALKYILDQHDPMSGQMTADEWLIRDREMKRIADQVIDDGMAGRL